MPDHQRDSQSARRPSLERLGICAHALAIKNVTFRVSNRFPAEKARVRSSRLDNHTAAKAVLDQQRADYTRTESRT